MTLNRWRYFSESESKNLVDDLMHKLDRARELFGFPIVITSGYRDPDHNKKAGGVDNSAHTKGMAVDIRAPIDPEMREKLTWALGAAGFRRVGSYNKHFHVDCAPDLPTPAWWSGESK